jgi:hypothetical protein
LGRSLRQVLDASVSIREQRSSCSGGLSGDLLAVLIVGKAPVVISLDSAALHGQGYWINRYTKFLHGSDGWLQRCVVVPMIGVVMAIFAPIVDRIHLSITPVQILMDGVYDLCVCGLSTDAVTPA